MSLIPINAYGVCGISTSQAIDFGNWKPAQTTAEWPITISNNGNSDADFSFSADPWVNGNDDSVMPRSATHYAYQAERDYDSKQTVKTNNDDSKRIEGNSQLIIYFQVFLNLLGNSLGYTGNVSQEFTFRLSC